MPKPRRWTYEHPDGPRVDVNGVEWYACDPYPCWYRWEDGELYQPRYTPTWPDDEPNDPRPRREVCPTCGKA